MQYGSADSLDEIAPSIIGCVSSASGMLLVRCPNAQLYQTHSDHQALHGPVWQEMYMRHLKDLVPSSEGERMWWSRDIKLVQHTEGTESIFSSSHELCDSMFANTIASHVALIVLASSFSRWAHRMGSVVSPSCDS